MMSEDVPITSASHTMAYGTCSHVLQDVRYVTVPDGLLLPPHGVPAFSPAAMASDCFQPQHQKFPVTDSK